MGLVTTYDYLVTIILVLMATIVSLLHARTLQIRTEIAFLTIATTFAATYAKYLIELTEPADPTYYYTMSLVGVQFNFGSDFLSFLTSILTTVLGFGFLPASFFFAAFAMLAFQLFYATFLRTGGADTGWLWHLAFLAIVLPSVAYWGSGISKEGLALLAIALFSFALTRTSGRVTLLSIAAGLLLLVRPHMGLAMLLAIGVGIVGSRDASPRERVTIAIAGSLAALALVPLIVTYIGIDNASLTDIGFRIEDQALLYADTAGYVNISDLPLPLKLLTYLFRPLPWEASSLIQLAAAGQNIVLFGMFAVLLPATFASEAPLRSSQRLSYLTFGIVGLLLLALTTANLGISTRQKWMVVLPLFYGLFLSWSARRQARLAGRGAVSASERRYALARRGY